jgi:hypothetical protein
MDHSLARSMVDKSPWPAPEAHRSSAIGRSGHREGAPMAWGDGGSSGEAHQGWISAVELVNRAGDEVMQ